MFDTRSPGMPTIEIGYGPTVVSAITAANPPAARAPRAPPAARSVPSA